VLLSLYILGVKHEVIYLLTYLLFYVFIFCPQRNLLTMNRQKSASLGALVLQTSLLALTIRYSRTETVSGPRYLTSTAVVMSELIKLVACLYMVAHSSKR